MNCLPGQKGFTFFELMIAVAVVGILAAAAIPAYQGYIDTANMTKVTASFEEAVRSVTNRFALRKTRIALGIQTIVPNTTEDWILLLNKEGAQAPGGGPAFIPSSNKKGEKGDATTGAIGVLWTPDAPESCKKYKKNGDCKKKNTINATTAQLELWRPLYSDLAGQHVTITQDDIEIKKFNK
jgi:prepilin-type N-terminal cleavage/methylation domain-containing protein